MTGQSQEEKMQVYVRLGIRLLYKGARGRMEGARARRLLKSIFIKQGFKYDSPESACDIPNFIEFHGVRGDEILEPISSFTQEKSLSGDYSLQDHDLADPGLFVQHTYLHFLWLPHSIMPLSVVIPSLLRIRALPDVDEGQPHPLHAFIEPLLLSLRAVASKYHNEILADGGGAGEAEESMMWYALGYEKTDASAERSEHLNREDPVMLEDKWISSWLERMEQREVQIQILLYFLKLSLRVAPAITLVTATPVKKPPPRVKSNASARSSSPIPMAKTSSLRPTERSSSPHTTGRSSSPPTARSSSLTSLGTGDDELPSAAVPLLDFSDSLGNVKDENDVEMWLQCQETRPVSYVGSTQDSDQATLFLVVTVSSRRTSRHTIGPHAPRAYGGLLEGPWQALLHGFTLALFSSKISNTTIRPHTQ